MWCEIFKLRKEFSILVTFGKHRQAAELIRLSQLYNWEIETYAPIVYLK
jgi:hypothetical protein